MVPAVERETPRCRRRKNQFRHHGEFAGEVGSVFLILAPPARYRTPLQMRELSPHPNWTERYPTEAWREIGNLIRNTAPHPGSLSAHICPSWASTTVRAMDSPMPIPLGLLVTNGSKTSFSLSSGMPGP